jgi:hypothetical protein
MELRDPFFGIGQGVPFSSMRLHDYAVPEPPAYVLCMLGEPFDDVNGCR